MRVSVLRLVLPVLCLAAAAVRGDDGKAPKQRPLLSRVAVLGASASAGFGVEWKGARVDLAQALDRTIKGEHETPANFSSEWFFTNPLSNAKTMVKRLKEHQPTLVVALDFLFWVGYGQQPSDERRMKSLERGLGFLEELDVPVLISTLPDMSAAIGTMLSPAQVPDPGVLEQMNDRIREWVDAHDAVVLVPLPEMVDAIQAGEEVLVRDTEYTPEEAKGLLQADHLHPTLDGLAGLAVLALQAYEDAGHLLPEDAVRWDPKDVAQRMRGEADG